MMLKKKNPHFNYIIALYNFDNSREEKTKTIHASQHDERWNLNTQKLRFICG